MFVLPLSRTSRTVSPQLGRIVDRLFDDSFDRYVGGGSKVARTPALDVSESDVAYTVAFDLPGVAREQLKVSVEGRRVSIETLDAPIVDQAESTADQTAPGTSRVLYRERGVARYARTVSLPAAVDPATSQAKFENGVLTLTLIKTVPTGATQLSID